MSRRAHMPLQLKLEACLIKLGLDPANVRWDHRPALSARMKGANNHTYIPDENDPRYIEPVSIAEHDKRTFGTSKATTAGSDIHTAAKVKRIERDEAAFRQRLLAKSKGEPRQKGKIPSRSFQKRRAWVRQKRAEAP